MKKKVFLIKALILLMPLFSFAQYTSLSEVQGQPAGIYTFNFGDGDFQAYVDQDGWMLWLQYHHQGGTNPALNVILKGNDLPIYDASPLGTDLSADFTKWGHGTQGFAASIPDEKLWLRWEAETSGHNRKIHFESPVIGRFQSNDASPFAPDISFRHILRDDHTAYLPVAAEKTTGSNGGSNALTNGPFFYFGNYGWDIRTSDVRWKVDDNVDGYANSTIHRVWVKPDAYNSDILMGALNDLHDHINGVQTLTPEALTAIKTTISVYEDRFTSSEAIMQKAFSVISDFDSVIGPLFTTSNTNPNSFFRDPERAPGLELERAVLVLQQVMFDYVFVPEIFDLYPEMINGFKYGSSVAFPGDVAPPSNPNQDYSVAIRANFEDPYGTNPFLNINAINTEHAYRPTGLYLAPGSVATISVPQSLVGKDYYIRVGAHEWDLKLRDRYTRFDRVSKLYEINSTSVQVFNPFGGAIAILVPYGASDGIVNISASNVVEAPFISDKTFYTALDIQAEFSKPAPWAVFETDRVMYTVPSHHVNLSKSENVLQAMYDWDAFVKGINFVLGRAEVPDKHILYMITDNLSRVGVNSLGYPMSNFPTTYYLESGYPVWFLDGPHKGYHLTMSHELGHAVAISKFVGEAEALVNFLYVMGMNKGLGIDYETAFSESFSPYSIGLNNTAFDRIIARTFPNVRNGSNDTTNEIRYQKRGYAHYAEIANMFGWCALRNFWEQEYFDAEAGNDHGINNQDNDSRIIRMSIAAETDLRPLFEFYGIFVQDIEATNIVFNDLNLLPSLEIYNRLNDYKALVPLDNAAYVAKALEIYPNLYDVGPTAPVDYAIGYYYQKSLTYNETEGQERLASLQAIIDKYYPDGAPEATANEVVCFADQTLGINNSVIDAEQGNDIVLYPNPAKDFVAFNFLDKTERNVFVKVYNINGKLVKSVQLNPRDKSIRVDTSGLASGLYIIGLRDKEKVIRKKIIIK